MPPRSGIKRLSLFTSISIATFTTPIVVIIRRPSYHHGHGTLDLNAARLLDRTFAPLPDGIYVFGTWHDVHPMRVPVHARRELLGAVQPLVPARRGIDYFFQPAKFRSPSGRWDDRLSTALPTPTAAEPATPREVAVEPINEQGVLDTTPTQDSLEISAVLWLAVCYIMYTGVAFAIRVLGCAVAGILSSIADIQHALYVSAAAGKRAVWLLNAIYWAVLGLRMPHPGLVTTKTVHIQGLPPFARGIRVGYKLTDEFPSISGFEFAITIAHEPASCLNGGSQFAMEFGWKLL
ncbi:hypothetical protein PENSPDRAFT_307413 [Peniophora sp. CONT]|nr:hypothetical protein PENSPDRAFT_307413 [Peniophora sp. CONT]